MADAADEIVILPEMKGGRTKLMELASSYEQDPKPSDDPASATAARDMPKEPSQQGTPDMTGSSAPTGITLASLEQNISNGPVVVIPLKSTAFRGSINYTNMPVAPGDIIVVPGGGNVMVTGWVYKPGYFEVGSGLTVLGAVASAGGAMFVASFKRSSVLAKTSAASL